MEYRFLKTDFSREGISILTISSPETLNALNFTILSEMDTFIDNLDTSSVRVLIITGEGKSFVAGADIAYMRGLSPEQALTFSQLGSSVFKKIENLSIPVIAAVNGFALGGGCELALACDIRIGSDRSSYGQPEVGLGVTPGFSGTYRLPKIVGSAFAKELIFTGKRIFSNEALSIGLLNSVVPADNLMETAIEMAEAIIKNAPIAVRVAKECINRNHNLSAENAIALENHLFAKCFESHDQKEGMEAFLGKRKPIFHNK